MGFRRGGGLAGVFIELVLSTSSLDKVLHRF
jgi:hypothetical protein